MEDKAVTATCHALGHTHADRNTHTKTHTHVEKKPILKHAFRQKKIRLRNVPNSEHIHTDEYSGKQQEY